VEIDCLGECGGTALVDECGICDGPGAIYECGCEDMPEGDCDCSGNVLDDCGECGGDNSSCLDCAGIPNGPNYEDNCGICDDNPDNDCVQPDNFGFNQSTMQAFYFFVTATIDNMELEVGSDWIGIFNGPICVGSAAWNGEYTSVPAMGDDGYGMTGGYLNPGDVPTFIIYDASADDYYDAEAIGVTPNLEFANLAQIFVDELAAVLTVPFSLDLHVGANLVSFYVLPDDHSLNSVLDGCVDFVTGIIGEGTVATPHPITPGEWIGNLSEFDANSGYWILLDQDCTIEYDGWSVDPAMTYNSHMGANLLSYPFANTSPFVDALPQDVLDLIIAIIGEGTVATPHPITPGDWIGNLVNFDPGNGYWFLLEEDVSFTYNPLTLARYEAPVPMYNEPILYQYSQSSEQAFYFVENVQITDQTVTDGDWILAYNNGTLVGKTPWMGEYTSIPVMGDNGMEWTSGYCAPGDIPSFKLLEGSTGDIINLEGNIQAWSSNGIYLSGTLTQTADLPGAFVLHEIYPNPFNPTTTITYSVPVTADVQVLVYDVMGRQVAELVNGNQTEGTHFVTFDASGYSSGLYFVKLISNGEIITQKIMLMK
ncbi:MAG: T9SS type A sorting domain-containing protein, partial [Fidelibacterota bacterium]